MFSRISPVFPLKNRNSVCAFTASTKYPILYIYYDDTLFEMSLLTNEMTLIRTFPSFDCVSIICDQADDLYVHGSNGCGSTYEGSVYYLAFPTRSKSPINISISPDTWITEPTNLDAISRSVSEPKDPWETLRESDLRELQSPIYHRCHSSGNIWIGGERSNVIYSTHMPRDDHVYYIYNAGNLGRDLSGAFTCEDTSILNYSVIWMAPYVDSHGNNEVIFLSANIHYHKLFTTKGNTLLLMWTSEDEISEDLVYSLVTKKIYRFSKPPYPWKDRSDNSTDTHISVFHYTVPSLFYSCSQVIRKHPDLMEQIPTCIRENMETVGTS